MRSPPAAPSSSASASSASRKLGPARGAPLPIPLSRISIPPCYYSPIVRFIRSIMATSASTSTHTNRLARETSPYLLQHQHNPVDWWPWGPEALAEAQRTGRPILLSIGYSACHWCHVMAHESFEDEATATVMNDLFVNVKVDREERPDVDAIYMEAVQQLVGSGGWPMTVWLDHEQRPFHAG